MGTFNNAVDDAHYNLTGRTDDGAVQMAAENGTLVISGTHVQVMVDLAVHGGDRTGQGDDLKRALKVIGVVFLFRGVIHADGEIIDRA